MLGEPKDAVGMLGAAALVGLAGVATPAMGQMVDARFGGAGRPVAAARAVAPGVVPVVREPIVAALEYDGTSTEGAAAQDFEAAYDSYDISVIEDFSVVIETELAQAWAMGFSETGNPFGATDFVMVIWEDDGSGFPCSADYTGTQILRSTRGAGFWDGARMNTDFGGQTLPAGHYFVEYFAVMDYGSFGQVLFFHQGGEHTVGPGEPNNAQHWNPGGGFALDPFCRSITDQSRVPTGVNFVICGNPGFPGDCVVDFNNDGVADVNDFFIFLDLFATGDARADLDGSGSLDVIDFFTFLDFFVSPTCQ